MMEALARRGPDSEGFEAWPGVGLGHRRLSILDLSAAGHQPMLSDDRNAGVVFNGCIYNFQELRAELEQHGHRFRSHCDTEVLVTGYLHWGIDDLVVRLRGMFAFAIWDEAKRTLFLVRDRLGVKPLVYKARDGEIAFASTIGALGAGGFRGAVDPAAVLQFLEYGNVAGDQCIFEQLSKLPPATILEWRDGKTCQRTYWTLPHWDETDSSPVAFDQAVEEAESLIVESTRLRLISDVPIAALLSGGVDSTLVCWALSKLNANLTAFTVGTPEDPGDETGHARQTARQLGIPHEVVELPPDRPEMLTEMEDAYSEPFASQSAQAMLRVSRAVKPKATVLLTGDGGDDVFLGYSFLHNAWLAQETARKLPAPLASPLRVAAACLPSAGPLRRLRRYLEYSTSGLAAYARAHDGLPYFDKYGILGERLQSLTLPQRNLIPSFDSARRLLSDVLSSQHRNHFLGEFMPKVDGATMYYSIESRSPFLDQKLWEFAARLSPRLRFHNGVLKAVLREIVRRRVDPAIASRPKQGFTVPVERWLAERWTRALDRLTQPTELERQGWVRTGSLERPIQDARARRWVPTQLWFLLILEHWLVRQEAP
jgi:asparagine synthase (glutamine-hydrolysing)